VKNLRRQRVVLILVAAVGLVAALIAVYLLFFAGSDYVEGRPSFVYFRLPT
jgi:hypothetical protein